jgi:hypothetical protein
MANNATHIPFYIQGVENVTGSAIVTVSAPGFSSTTIAVTVSEIAVEIQQLVATTTANAADDTQWYVQVGLPNQLGSALGAVQSVRDWRLERRP